MDAIIEGQRVALVPADDSPLIVTAGESLRKGDTVIPTNGVLGMLFGDRFEALGKIYTIAPPSWLDTIEGFKRGAQVILPHDAVRIVQHASVGPGSIVVEGGTGTGFLTSAQAFFVGPSGKVHTFDRRAEATGLARKNLDRAGVLDRIELHTADIADCSIDDADAFVLDVPEPWNALETAERALRPGGALVSYIPNTNQAERLMRSAGAGFTRPRCFESIRREWTLSRAEEGVRPQFDGLAHTGFIVSARRL